MKVDPFSTISRRRMGMIAVLLIAAILLTLLAACGGSEPTARVVFITATFTPEPAVLVVTATPSPQSPVEGAAADTPVPPPTLAQPSDTLPPPATATPDQVLTAQAILTAFATPQAQPTDTPVPPTAAPTAAPAATAAPKPTAAPKASLNSYGVIYSNFDPGPETDEFKYSVWVMRGDGSEAKELFRPAIEPAYSLNGQKVAFYRPFNGIWVYDVAKQTTSHVVVSDYAEYPSFSPDGTQLVFHEFVGTYWSMDGNLYVAKADGSERHQILDNAIRPSWAPKGNLIVFDTCRGTSCGIFVVQPNGQGFRQVVSDGGGKASWSPDGKKIIYSAEVNGNSEIFVVNLDGSGRKQLTKNTGNDTLPVYSPDGQYIFFLSDQNGKAWAIRVMRPDGSDIKTIRKIGVPPRWQFSRLDVDWW